MKNYFKSILLFFKRFLLVLFIYQICRFLFLYFNKSAFSGLDLKVFLGGIHFDLSAIAYINILFVFLHLFPAKFIYKKGYQRALKIAFYTVNLIFILTNFVDFEYYKFNSTNYWLDYLKIKSESIIRPKLEKYKKVYFLARSINPCIDFPS